MMDNSNPDLPDQNVTDQPPQQLATPLHSAPSTPFPTNGVDLIPPTPNSTAVDTRVPIPRLSAAREVRSLQRITRACVPCQKKKTKCDGGKPRCSPCRRSGAVCTYTKSKREHQRSQFQSLEEKIKTYESLLQEIVSQSTQDNRKSMRDAIYRRLTVSPEFFSTLLSAKSLSDQVALPPKPELTLGRMHEAWESNRHNKGLSLLQQPLVRATYIEKWTSLVDSEVASHLFSLYFVWENPTWQLIDQTMFMHDLELGHNRFCSSLLVHTLLFFGCSFSYNLNRITDRRAEKVLSGKLYAAIQRLWHIEKDRFDLPTAQASVLLGLLFCTFGIDKIGTKYIMHGAELSARLGLNKEHSSYISSDVDGPPTVLICQKLVSWAVFDIQGLASQVYRKEPVWKEPPSVSFSREEAAMLDQGVEWCPYPFQTPVTQPFFYTAAWVRSELVVIVHDIARFALRYPGAVLDSSDWECGYSLYQRLLAWRTELPLTVLPRHNTTPHVLCLHFYYHATIVSLCEIFLLNSSTGADNTRYSRFDPGFIKSQAMDTIGSLVLLFRHSHGWKSIPIVMLHYFCVAGVHAVSRLHPHDPKWSLVLESSVVGLWHMSLGWGRLCKAFLRTIELVVKARRPDPSLIPPNVSAVFDQISNNLWTDTDTSSLAADYMVHHVPSIAGPSAAAGSEFKAHTLQNLLTAMEGLSLSPHDAVK